MRIPIAAEQVQIGDGFDNLALVGMIGKPVRRVGQRPRQADKARQSGEQKQAQSDGDFVINFVIEKTLHARSLAL